MNNEDTYMDSMIATFNIAVTETASDILGKIIRRKRLRDKRRELRKKRIETDGFGKYREVNNNIKRFIKKKKKWIGEQYSESEVA